MSDMFRVATPIINNNIVQPVREQLSAESSPIDLTDKSKVYKAYSGFDLTNQNNGNISRQMTPEVLGNMLKDPNVTVNFIKNIMALREIIGDISAQGLSGAEEFEQLFNEFAVEPENLAQELLSQERLSTAFRGNLFDSLRELMRESSDPRIKTAITNFLKAVNNENSKSEILKTLSDTLKYLSDVLSSDKSLSDELYNLSEKFSLDNAENNFSELMNETEQLLCNIERNISSDNKLLNLCSMIKYNLSKYNANTDIIGKSVKNIMQFIPEKELRTEFMQKLFEYLSGFENRSFDSKILDALFKFFQGNANNEYTQEVENSNAEASVNSFLASQNQDVAEELEQAFKEIVLKSENFANDFVNSEQHSTAYKGKIFDTLRELINENTDPEVKTAVKNLLKAIYIENGKSEILKNFSEEITDLSEIFSQNKSLPEENALINIAKDIAKFIPTDKDKSEFIQEINKYFSGSENENSDSKMLDAVIKVFQNQMDKDGLMQLKDESAESAVYSILSSENPDAAEELEQAFNELAEKSESMAKEFLNSEDNSNSASFKGELFDNLREMFKENTDPEVKEGIINLLKAINIENNKPEILKSFSEAMTGLSEKIMQNKSLPDELQSLAERGFLSEASSKLMKFIPNDQLRAEFLQKLYNGAVNFEGENTNSKVLDTLVKILQKQTDNESVMQMKSESIETVIRSLLSSPGNFTPLLHFVLPIDDGIFKTFGEMWINPDEEEKKTDKDSKSSSEIDERMMHMLLVFDIPDVGRFETELWVKGKKINMSLLCPPVMEDYTNELSSDLKNSINFSEYFFDEIKVGKLEKKRSLIEVFPVLPQKRNGINVRI